MAVERLDLGFDDQWIEREVRPTHGTIRRLAKDLQRFINSSDPLEAEDALVTLLVKEWHVLDGDGNPLPLQKSSFEKVPQDVWGKIIDDLNRIIEGQSPGNSTARMD